MSDVQPTNVYRAYGLTCLSNASISAFPRSATNPESPDVIFDINTEAPHWVRLARSLPSSILYSQPGQFESPTHTVTALGRNEFFELAYGDGTRFVIDGAAQRIWGACGPPLTPDHLAVYLQGPVMGFLLRRRGITALHASAVCVNGHAVLLCGPSEAGKSTTAAALALRGAAVLSDDITALTESSNEFLAESGALRICLWPDAVRALFGTTGALPLLTPDWEKRFLPLDGDTAKFKADGCPIGAIYMLSSRSEAPDAPQVENLTTREALFELVKNTYMNWLLERRHRAAEFDVLSKLVMQIPVRRILAHSDPTRIGALCELIASDAGRLIARAAPVVVSTH
jgi:hypothetical protein